jgi:hypothetical protein
VTPGDPATTAVVNQTFAATYFPGIDPTGQSFRLSPAPAGYATGQAMFQVAGVVQDVKNQGVRQPAHPGTAAMAIDPIVALRQD